MVLKILAVTSEAYPLAKTGGLGDAVSGLAQALSVVCPQFTLMLPAYRCVWGHVSEVKELACLVGLPGGDATLLSAHCDELDVPVLLLRNDKLYDREGIYLDENGNEYADAGVRFAALAQAAARIAEGIPGVPRPDVVHAHDWHAALVPLYMHQYQVQGVRSVLTLHNIAFQGVFPLQLAPELGIGEQYCGPDALEYWGQMNFLKAGLRYADLITVVSRNYGREILTPQFGCGLEDVLRERSSDLVSIPNGIDTQLWNPSADAFLEGLSFSADDLSKKAVCKRRLQERFGLTVDRHATILAMGSRLTTQKMADVAAQALPRALDEHPDLQVCIIGKGEKSIEAALQALNDRYPGRCAVHIGFEESLAHWLHAGADILLHGSRFEPFGLTPLYSMRYGTLPIGSRVGGMVDTINDPGEDSSSWSMRQANGFLFSGDSPDEMFAAIERALAVRQQPMVWRAMQLNAMSADYAWDRTAPAYVRAYESLAPAASSEPIPAESKLAARAASPATSAVSSRPQVAVSAGAALQGATGLSVPRPVATRRKRKASRTDTLVSAGSASAA